MGPGDTPRTFLYNRVRDYLLADHPGHPTDWPNTIRPAYEEEISGLARGPFALIFASDKPAFNAKVAAHIQTDFEAMEPYVDKVVRYLAATTLCVLVWTTSTYTRTKRLSRSYWPKAWHFLSALDATC